MRDTTSLLTKGQKQRRMLDGDQSSELSTALSIDSAEQPQAPNWPTRRKMMQLKKQRCKTNCVHLCWLCLGIFLMLGSLQMLWAPTYLEHLVHDGIAEALIFTSPAPDNDNYAKWVSNDHGEDSIPIKVSLQFFNVTNPEDLTNGLLNVSDRIPKFSLTPPIVYTQYYYRENISFSADGSMVRSYFKTRFFHDAQLSELAEDDIITIIAPLASAGKHMYEKNGGAQGAAAKFLYNGFFSWLDSDVNNLFSTATAHDLIFSILDVKFPQNDTLIPPLGPRVKAGSLVDFQYGLLKNGSGSWYISHTGYGDERRMGEVLKWSNQAQDWEQSASDPVLINFDDDNFTFIDCWYPHLPYSPAHFIYQGVWNIMQDAESNLPAFFVSTLKRPLVFDYDKPVKFKNIPAQQYNMSTGRQFMNESQYPPNAQFYQFGPSGVMNMTNCFNDLPLFFSLPHFYGAPDFAANNTKLGISEPITERDSGGFLQVEPMTGAVLNAQVSLQGNVPLGPLPEYDANISADEPSLTHLPPGIMAPTYLLRYEAHLPDNGAKTMAKQISLASNIDHGLYYFGYVCVGLAVIYWSYTMYWFGQHGASKMFPGLCCPLQAQMQDAQF
eukprot:CAMPEP_0197028670 /NCGR_PEP_ID=MMETSP1384-20130603/8298_1 /TAXON_ID=29189 /ORGANISM="Ammonia sp." /LENGTH=608 /DNA_ID=CAMNT_0042457705 /DNA_START=96 /DNA_END=1922 /DNA_ORIENTATION=+